MLGWTLSLVEIQLISRNKTCLKQDPLIVVQARTHLWTAPSPFLPETYHHPGEIGPYAYKLTCFIIVDTIVTTVHQNYQLYRDSGNAPNHFSAGIVSLGSKKMFVMNDDSAMDQRLAIKWKIVDPSSTLAKQGLISASSRPSAMDQHIHETPTHNQITTYEFSSITIHSTLIILS